MVPLKSQEMIWNTVFIHGSSHFLMCLSLPAWAYVHHVCSRALGSQKRVSGPHNWSSRRPWANTDVLGVELRFPAGAISALHHWDISLPPNNFLCEDFSMHIYLSNFWRRKIYILWWVLNMQIQYDPYALTFQLQGLHVYAMKPRYKLHCLSE